MDLIFEFDDQLGATPAPAPAPTRSPPPPNEIIIGDYGYACENILGHGAFAVVYKGRCRDDSHPTAIKVISKTNAQLSPTRSNIEISILEELTGLKHPNIVTLFGFQDTGDKFYLFMEYCNQKNLDEYIHKQGTLSEDTIRGYLQQISKAMNVLFNKGIIHRDLKPQNILLHSNIENPTPSDMILKIADFGLARFVGEGVMCATVCGTSIYMAPEVLLSQPYDHKADIWSIGAIAYQCFTGNPPCVCANESRLAEYYKGHDTCIVDKPIGASKQFWQFLYEVLQPLPDKRLKFSEFHQHEFLCPTRNVDGIQKQAEIGPNNEPEIDEDGFVIVPRGRLSPPPSRIITMFNHTP